MSTVTFYTVPPPLTGMFKMGQAEYAVIAARNSDIDFGKIRAPRLLVVAETEKQILSFAPQIQVPVRFTSDERLFTLTLEQMFLSFNRETGKLEKDVAQVGEKENEQVAKISSGQPYHR